MRNAWPVSGPWLTIVIALGICVATPTARANPSADAIRAAKLLRAWQFEKARDIIEPMVAAEPKSEVSRYLQAELDFFDGRYAQVIAGLEGMEDADVDNNVGPLRSLAASSHQVTKDFQSKLTEGGHFQIFYAKGKDEAIVDLTGEVLEAAYEALGKDLGHRPSSVIRVELLGAPSDLAMVSTLKA